MKKNITKERQWWKVRLIPAKWDASEHSTTKDVLQRNMLRGHRIQDARCPSLGTPMSGFYYVYVFWNLELSLSTTYISYPSNYFPVDALEERRQPEHA